MSVIRLWVIITVIPKVNDWEETTMEDLLFKDIPAEGFDPNCGFTDRISNPTPTRSNIESAAVHQQCSTVDDRMSNAQTGDNDITGYSSNTDRLSNATPSRRNSSNRSTSQSIQTNYNSSEEISSAFDASRASNPTPSRRASVSSSVSSPEDDYSCPSNPTPTRRFQDAFVEPPIMFPDAVTEAEESYNRPSNPTPTRRGSRVSSSFFNSDTAESLTFESTDDPYGVGVQSGVVENRASNPMPTRRTTQTSYAQNEGLNLDDDRMSNYIPSQHK